MKLAHDYRQTAWDALKSGAFGPFFAACLVLTAISFGFSALIEYGQSFTELPQLIRQIQEASNKNRVLPMETYLRFFQLYAPWLLITAPFGFYMVGFSLWAYMRFALGAVRKEAVPFAEVWSAWGHGWKMGWVFMVQGTYIFLWALLYFPLFALIPFVGAFAALAIIPVIGIVIVKSLAYAMTPFVAYEHPTWTANQCITESRRLMAGHKWRFFCLLFSFIGWFLLFYLVVLLCLTVLMFFAYRNLHLLSLAVPIIVVLNLVLGVYILTAVAAFYDDRKLSEESETL